VHPDHPGAASAPEEANQAFSALKLGGYRFARPARTVYWKTTDTTYWIQWTLRDIVAILWACDPVEKKAVKICIHYIQADFDGQQLR
jgi:hypothetical protein